MTISREAYEAALDTIEDMRETMIQMEEEKDELAHENLRLIVINQALIKMLNKWVKQGNN